MSSPASRSPLAGIARIVLLAGALASVALTLYASRHNQSLLLRLIFVIWVLFPFLATLLANRASAAWHPRTGAALHVASLLLTVAVLAVYADVAFGHPGFKMGLIFLVVPPGSGLLIAIAALIASLL